MGSRRGNEADGWSFSEISASSRRRLRADLNFETASTDYRLKIIVAPIPFRQAMRPYAAGEPRNAWRRNGWQRRFPCARAERRAHGRAPGREARLPQDRREGVR